MYDNEEILEDYNDVPVHYCSQCLSLKIINIPGSKDECYCDICGNTEVKQAHIEEWEEMYKNKYDYKYLNLKGNERKY